MRTPPPWEIVTEMRPAMLPTYETTPEPAARTTDPSVAARSTPKCPDQAPVGPNGRTTWEPETNPSPKHTG